MKTVNVLWKNVKDCFDAREIVSVSNDIYFTKGGMGVDNIHHNDDEIVTIFYR